MYFFLGKLRITCTIHWQLKVYFVRAMDRNGLGHICRQIWLSSHMDHWLSRKFVLHFRTPGVATYQSSSQLVFSCNSDFFSALSYKLDLNLTDSICSNGQQKEESQTMDFQSMNSITNEILKRSENIFSITVTSQKRKKKEIISKNFSCWCNLETLCTPHRGQLQNPEFFVSHLIFNFITFCFQL